MDKISLISLLGKPVGGQYNDGHYTFSDGNVIKQKVFSLALFENFQKTNKVSDMVVIGSKESVWFQFYNCLLDLVKRIKPNVTLDNYQEAKDTDDYLIVIEKIKQIYAEIFACKFNTVIYDSEQIKEQKYQAEFVKEIISLNIEGNIQLDITLSFRYVPLLVFTALEYKSLINNISFNNIYFAKLINKDEGTFKTIRLDVSKDLFSDTLSFNDYKTSGELSLISELITDKELQQEFAKANLAEDFGRYAIANKKFYAIKDKLINEFSKSIAFDSRFFNDRLNWVNENNGNLIKLSEHYFNSSNYTNTILSSCYWCGPKQNPKSNLNGSSLKKLHNKYRTLIIHMINSFNFSSSEKNFKDGLNDCLTSLTRCQSRNYKFMPNKANTEDNTGTLVSIIGSGRYSPTNYMSDEFSLENIKYIGSGMAKNLRDQGKINKFFVCGTETANWNEFFASMPMLINEEGDNASQLVTELTSRIEKVLGFNLSNTIKLSKAIASEINVVFKDFQKNLGVEIEVYCYDDKDEDNGDFYELLGFTKLNWENSNIYLDITHGYRSIPFVLFFAFLTICSRCNNVLKKVYYGYSDMNKSSSNESSNGWLLDETYLLKLIKYSFDISQFKKSNNFLYLKDLFVELFNDEDITQTLQDAAMKENLHMYIDAGKDFAKLYKLIQNNENCVDNIVFDILKDSLLEALNLLQTDSQNEIDVYVDRVRFYLNNCKYKEAIFASYESFRKLGQAVKSIYEKHDKVIPGDLWWIKDAYKRGKDNAKKNGKNGQINLERCITASINRRYGIEIKSSKIYDLLSNYRRVITNELDSNNINSPDIQNCLNAISNADINEISKILELVYDHLLKYKTFVDNLEDRITNSLTNNS